MCRLVRYAVAGFVTWTRAVVSMFVGWGRMYWAYLYRMAHFAWIVGYPVAGIVDAWACSAADLGLGPQGYGSEPGKRLACLLGIGGLAESFAKLPD